MSKVTLSKELIEAVISDRYLDATSFVWNGNEVSFDYDGDNNFDAYNRKNLIDNLNNLTSELFVMQGKIEQAEKDFKQLLRECFNGQ